MKLIRPEYLFRPSQILIRILRSIKRASENVNVKLPWGGEIEISLNDAMGKAIWLLGVYDLALCELVWRLANEGETNVDVGANVGLVTSIMSVKSAQTGRVLSLEAHPEVYKHLKENAKHLPISNVECHHVAAADHCGMITLNVPPHFRNNSGVSSVIGENALDGIKITVPALTLDKMIDRNCKIGVLKIDVEGAELIVLSGATQLLIERRVRDIVYEDHAHWPSPVAQFLLNFGFTIFKISHNLRKPLLLAPGSTKGDDSPAANYLATIDVQRVQKLLAQSGWECLKRTS